MAITLIQPFNLDPTGNYTLGNVATSGIVSATGNITGNYILGNGAFLTGTSGSYSNATVADYLASGDNNSNIITTANLTAGNIQTIALTTLSVTANGNISAGEIVSATGNIVGNYIIGNGSQLTGLPAGYSNTNVATYLSSGTNSSNIVTTANVSGGNVLTVGVVSAAGTGYFGAGLSVTGNITATGNLNYQNITDLVVGDPLIYIGANNTADLVDLGIVASANVAGTYQHLGIVRNHSTAVWNFFANVVAEPTTVIDWANAVLAPVSAGNITGSNISTTGLVSATGTVTGSSLLGSVVSASANITGGNILTSGLVSGSTLSATANIFGGNIEISGTFLSNSTIITSANITGGNLQSFGDVTSTGNVVANYIIADGSLLTGTYGNSNVAEYLSSGDDTSGFVTSANVEAGYFIGNGALLTGISSGSSTKISNGTSEANIGTSGGNANITIGGTSNVVVVANTGVYMTGIASATGNITGGNIQTGGVVSATGNITGGNILGGANVNATTHTGTTVSVTANITGGNLLTAGQVSSTGNITSAANVAGGNIRTTGLISATSTITSAANIIGGNLLTAGLISATSTITSAANVIGGNLLTVGLVSATGTITSAANITGGNVLTGGLISATGNIVTAANFVGNSFVAGTGGGGTIAGANLISANVFSAAGNITGGNVLTGGVVSATGNITSADNITGGNILTGGLISATGNVTGGNILTGGAVSATGNITGGNILGGANVNATTHTGTTVSVTANITGGNILTGGVVSATSNVTGGNLITPGLITAAGNVITSGSVFANGIVSATGNLISDSELYVGNGAQGTGLTNPIVVARATGTAYVQVAAQNTANTGSADLVTYADNGTDSDGWTDMGMAGSGFNDTAYTITYANDGYLFVQGNALGTGGNLVLATGDYGKDIVFATGGFLSADEKMRFINATGQFYIQTTTTANSSTTGALRVVGGAGIGGNVYSGGLISAVGNIVTVANIAGNNISTTNSISAGGNVTGGNLLTVGQVSATGNVSGDYIIGNGSQLTGLPATYANSDVAVYLASGTDTSNIITTANVSGGNLVTGGLVSATGNVIANNINVTNWVTGANVSTTGNVLIDGYISVVGNLYVANIVATSNLVVQDPLLYLVANSAYPYNFDIGFYSHFVGGAGNTYQHTGLARDYTDGTWKLFSNVGEPNGSAINFANAIYDPLWSGAITSTGNVSATGNVIGGNVVTAGIVSASGNITGSNINTGGIITAAGNIDSAGNISATYFIGNGALLTGIGAGSTYSNANVDAYLPIYTGNIAANNLSITTSLDGNIASLSGNITGGNVLTGGLISAASNVVSAANITGGNVLSSALIQGVTISSSGNVVGGNILTGGVISSAGNVTVSNLSLSYGAISTSGMTYDPASYLLQIGGTGPANIRIDGFSGIYAGIGRQISAIANVTGGNINTGGVVSATGDITSSGNISGNYIIGNGSQLTGLPAGYANSDVATYLASGTNSSNIVTTANVSGGNLLTGGLISSTGNITGSNLSLSYGAISTSGMTYDPASYLLQIGGTGPANIRIDGFSGIYAGIGRQISAIANVTGGNINTGGVVSATGNITGDYFIGNGSLLTGISSGSSTKISNGTSEANIGTADGNANITIGGTANVVVVANTGVYVSGITSASGNIVTAGNIVTGGGTGGNITGANVISSTTLSASANVTGGNIISAGVVSAAGNVTGGNIISAGVVSAAGNIQLSNGWVINTSSTKLTIYFGATAVFSIDSTGNVIADADVTAYGTP